jgi:hypothetical protein
MTLAAPASVASRAGRRPLVFGIYPGGAAGTVGPAATVIPEDPAARLSALEQLRVTGKPFVLHLYASYTGPGGWSAAQQLGSQIAQYEAAGFQLEVVLTYRPSDGGSASDVSGFAAFVRATVQTFGGNPDFVSLQVTNEANVGGAPDASDGYYAYVKDALIQGVVAAKREAVSDGYRQLMVGFNWAWSNDPGEAAFWTYLGKGGSAFAGSLDWVGLDAYPGTWGPLIGGDLAGGTAGALNAAIVGLRRTLMPLAGIPKSIPIHISENGYPTGPGRTYDMQSTALSAAVNAVNSSRGTYNVTEYNFFDLRDANSSSASFEDQYGLMTDRYSPKPAFAVYHQLIATLG